MDSALVQRVMFRTTAADIHAVTGLVQEYLCADHLAHRDLPDAPEWQQVGRELEHCLRLYLAGTPVPLARRVVSHSQ